MGLSPRTLNALINGNILSVEQLTRCTETKLT
jgi:DNA-directed RNA polymerase subunit alpha